MIIVDTYDIEGHDDFELNIKRDSLLTYHLAYNNEKEPDGIIFVVPGFGNDGVVSYQINLIKYIAEQYNLLAVFVEYHALFARESNSNDIIKKADCKFSSKDIEIIIQYLDLFKIELNDNQLDYETIVTILDNHIEDLKSQGKLEEDFKLNI